METVTAQKAAETYDYAQKNWGDKWKGIYAMDEPAGNQLDLTRFAKVRNVVNYADAANQWINNTSNAVENFAHVYFGKYYPLVAADYALYWFDYKAGLDNVLAELGWNYSRQLNIALCRGAATVQNKEWGTMIAWTYTNPPYIESGPQLFNDLVLAYENGAKYITVFDSNLDYSSGILGAEHFQALRQFWQYVEDNPRGTSSLGERVAFVLPKDYGYGFRGPNDKIWGLWGADAFSYNLSVSVGNLLQKYGDKLDIIYDDGLVPANTAVYSKLIYWNAFSPSPPAISVLSVENRA